MFDSKNPWTADQARQAWRTWILQNGFRDAAEAISGTLEEVQTILSYWHVAGHKAQRNIPVEDWNKFVVRRGQEFHGCGLPAKVKFLEKHYSFTLDSVLLDQIETMNKARNCLAHRDGVITTRDVNVDGALEVRWTAFVLLLVEDGKEVELHPPDHVEADALLAVRNSSKSKRLAIGQQVDFTSPEFAQMCWTCFLFAKSCADRLEAYSRQRGVQFGEVQPNQGAAGALTGTAPSLI